VAGIFGRDQVGFFKYPQCPQGYIFQIADGGADYVQSSAH
jgi:hypothetical protein